MIGGGGAALTGGAIDLAGLVPAATGVGIPLSVPIEAGGTALGLGGVAVAGHGAAVAGNSGRLLWDDLMHAMSDSSPSKDGGQSPGGGSGKPREGAGDKPVERPGEEIPRIEAGSSKVNSWTKLERLKMVFDKLSKTPKAKTADEAMQQLNETLDAIEEVHSGAPKMANPGLKSTARMYSAQIDRITRASDGTINAASRGHIAIYGPKGSITVIDRTTGKVVFQKAGGG